MPADKTWWPGGLAPSMRFPSVLSEIPGREAVAFVSEPFSEFHGLPAARCRAGRGDALFTRLERGCAAPGGSRAPSQQLHSLRPTVPCWWTLGVLHG